MKKPRKKQGAEYEFFNMFIDAINWDRINNITPDEIKAFTDKQEKEKEDKKE